MMQNTDQSCICRRISKYKMIFAVSVVLTILIKLNSVDAACPGVVTKKEWDGLSPLHVKYLPRPISLVIIQHTVTPACSTDAACENIVRSIQNVNMEQNNYWDIGISFLIGGNGKVYEGNGWLHVGAHTYGYNSKSIGISFIGNYNNDEPKPEALAAAKALIKCGVEQGHLTPDYHLVAHKQLIATESPGRKLYREIRTWQHFLADVSSIKNS
ncbi:peptidoglycan recognition protein-like [Nymphalis io]|uniref:peptidoglycan recognition protein-like n=1 Tax=Inachis io TaxID=171585 RepID=UPI0021692823|nr:peptidoglycan recognition protein-like [Nymphalis io]